MSRGCHHVISTEEKLTGKITPLSDFDKTITSPAGSKLTIASGVYQFWNSPVHPFFAEMPEWLVLHHDDMDTFDKLQSLSSLLSEEIVKSEPGSERIVQSYLDVMFSLIMRKIVKQNSSKKQTWSHAIHESSIRKSLDALHADVSKNWSLDELAKHAGISRAGFALKFKNAMGDTPLHYLTILRVQFAMELLSTTDMNVESVAFKVGYKDAFNFSKAFKKVTGLPPREFRLRDIEERKIAWRL